MNDKLIKELIKRLDIRKSQLMAQMWGDRYGTNLGYKVTPMHHMRDITTILAILQDKPNAEDLLKNMPKLPEE